ncbi:MAG TPA: cation transporter [Dongiaceae bacterium]|jgi:mercuric ion binding protein|nr:cation transporter [Dongiaceae bacterium]
MLRFLILLQLLLSASIAAAAERTVTLTVANMTCALCPITVRTAIEHVAGVKDVQVDFETKTAVVVFDDAEATVEDIAEASRLAGYPAAPEE